jgi:hypothetical protein
MDNRDSGFAEIFWAGAALFACIDMIIVEIGFSYVSTGK